jgi:hypothetical protein
MENNFVPYKLAVALKELGFDEPCIGNYFHTKELKIYGGDVLRIKNSDMGTVTAPLWQQAEEWFRNKYNALSIIFNDDGDVEYNNICFNYEIRFITISFKEELKASVVGNYSYNNYEEARLACLQKLIEICKEKKS